VQIDPDSQKSSLLHRDAKLLPKDNLLPAASTRAAVGVQIANVAILSACHPGSHHHTPTILTTMVMSAVGVCTATQSAPAGGSVAKASETTLAVLNAGQVGLDDERLVVDSSVVAETDSRCCIDNPDG
jgi:hypothetical protein